MPKSPLMIMKSILVAAMMLTLNAQADDLLIKVKKGTAEKMVSRFTLLGNTQAEALTDTWIHLKGPSMQQINQMRVQLGSDSILYVQPNYKLVMYGNYKSQDPVIRSMALQKMQEVSGDNPIDDLFPKAADNPAIPAAPSQSTGSDPLISSQWGMLDIGARSAWNVTKGNPNIVVAVIDTGVDYTHEDLLPNMWRNPGESGNSKETNGIDDDKNGYIDDVVGWDFAYNDSKPYDLSTSNPFELIISGGNPGHGTHCAGNVAARGDNGKGISGVAPNVRIMAIRFLTEKGQGTTEGAIKSIKYAVDNGAKVLSNSWGSEGDDPKEGQLNQALKDIIKYAQDKGVLFIAAAGNGHQGAGYNNDTDPRPGVPASYDNENIISVAALDSNNQLGSFSNWGARTVDIGAPGVKVFSTVPGNQYQDTVINLPDFGLVATWDGTSMATPHVAGAAALYWSAHPEKSWSEVKAALLNTAAKIPAMAGKSVSGGKLNVDALLR